MHAIRNHIHYFSKIMILLVSCLSVSCFSPLSYAGLNGVKKIIITSSSSNTSQWLQVSEVVAIESGSQKDIALTSKGATAKGTSFYSKKTHAGNVISGVAPNRYPMIYHSGAKDKSPVLEIALASTSQLDSIAIYGRVDCCAKRDFYNITLLNEKDEIIFQKINMDASNKAHLARVDLVKSDMKSNSKPAFATAKKEHSTQLKQVKVSNQKISNVDSETVNNIENGLIEKKSTPEFPPALKTKEKRVATNHRSKEVTSRSKDYYRELLRKGLKEVEAENFDAAVKYFDQIIFDNVKYPRYSPAKIQHDYWIKSAKREKKLAYAKKNIDRSKELYDQDTVQNMFVKAVKAYTYDRDYPLAKKIYREIMDHTLEFTIDYNRAKSELDSMDANIAKRNANDEKNRILADKIRAKEKLAQEQLHRDEEKRKHEQAAAAEHRRQLVLNNNKRYPLKNLKFSSSSMISYDRMEIGKTKKDDAIIIYDRLLKEEYAKEVDENDISFTIRQVISGPRVRRSSLFVEQTSFKIHEYINIECFMFFGIHSNEIVNDCLYFYKDILVGGRFNRGNKTPESIVNLAPFFPVKENYVSNNVVRSLQRSNGIFVFKSLTGGYTTTTKTTRKTALTPVGVTSYKNSNHTFNLICISPKELNEMLAKFSKRYTYSCH